MTEEKRELIRKAAVKIMADEGFYNTKASQIAAEAGIAVGTIYNYFNSKEDILEYIFAVELRKRLSWLNQIKEETTNNLEKIEAFLKWHFTEIKNSPAVGKILVREKEFPRKNDAAAITDYLNMIPESLEQIINKAIKAGEIKKCNPEIKAAVIFGAVQGIVERAIYNQKLSLLDEAADEIMAVFIKMSLK